MNSTANSTSSVADSVKDLVWPAKMTIFRAIAEVFLFIVFLIIVVLLVIIFYNAVDSFVRRHRGNRNGPRYNNIPNDLPLTTVDFSARPAPPTYETVMAEIESSRSTQACASSSVMDYRINQSHNGGLPLDGGFTYKPPTYESVMAEDAATSSAPTSVVSDGTRQAAVTRRNVNGNGVQCTERCRRLHEFVRYTHPICNIQ